MAATVKIGNGLRKFRITLQKAAPQSVSNLTIRRFARLGGKIVRGKQSVPAAALRFLSPELAARDVEEPPGKHHVP